VERLARTARNFLAQRRTVFTFSRAVALVIRWLVLATWPMTLNDAKIPLSLLRKRVRVMGNWRHEVSLRHLGFEGIKAVPCLLVTQTSSGHPVGSWKSPEKRGPPGAPSISASLGRANGGGENLCVCKIPNFSRVAFEVRPVLLSWLPKGSSCAPHPGSVYRVNKDGTPMLGDAAAMPLGLAVSLRTYCSIPKRYLYVHFLKIAARAPC
jgi:hypothetical protein